LEVLECFSHGYVKNPSVGRMISRGGTRGFFLKFSRGPKVVKYDFSHSKLRKQPLFAENFKIQRGQGFSTPMMTGFEKGGGVYSPAWRRTNA